MMWPLTDVCHPQLSYFARIRTTGTSKSDDYMPNIGF